MRDRAFMGWGDLAHARDELAEAEAGLPVAEVKPMCGRSVRLSIASGLGGEGRSILLIATSGRAWLGTREINELIEALVCARDMFLAIVDDRDVPPRKRASATDAER